MRKTCYNFTYWSHQRNNLDIVFPSRPDGGSCLSSEVCHLEHPEPLKRQQLQDGSLVGVYEPTILPRISRGVPVSVIASILSVVSAVERNILAVRIPPGSCHQN
jgi:hypothetical protein